MNNKSLSILLSIMVVIPAFGQNVNRQIANLTAFSKVYGIARWFVPSDEAFSADWDSIAVSGVQEALGYENDRELAEGLKRIFGGYVPMFLVDANPVSAELESYFSADHSDADKIRWQHYGVDLGPLSHDYISRRIGRPYSSRNISRFAFSGNVNSQLSDTDEVTLEIVCKSGSDGGGTVGCFWMGTWSDTEEFITPLYRSAPCRRNLGEEWETISITYDLQGRESGKYVYWGIYPENDDPMCIRSVRILSGSGKELYLLDASLGWSHVARRCWYTPRSYYYSGDDDAVRTWCRKDVFEDTESRTHIDLCLGEDLYAHLPLLLYDGYASPGPSTVPVPTEQARQDTGGLADLIVMWNIIRYFSPYLYESGLDWDAELEQALEMQLMSGNDGNQVLQKMLAKLKDAHIDYPNMKTDMDEKVFPAVFTIIGEKAVVKESMSQFLHAGDVISMVAGKDLAEYLEESLRLYSAGRHTAISRLYQSPFVVDSDETECRIERNGETMLLAVPTISQREYYDTYWTNYFSDLPVSRWISENICYINITSTSFIRAKELLEQVTDDKYAIIDMRKNMSDFVVRDLLMPYVGPEYVYNYDVIPDYTPMSSFPESQRPRFDAWRTSPMNPNPSPKFIILTSPADFSNLDVLCDFIKNKGLATLIGEPTGGTSGAINTATLPSGLQVVFSGQRAYSKSGMEEDYFGNGVIPHIIVSPTIESLCTGKDVQLEEALNFIHLQMRNN